MRHSILNIENQTNQLMDKLVALGVAVNDNLREELLSKVPEIVTNEIKVMRKEESQKNYLRKMRREAAIRAKENEDQFRSIKEAQESKLAAIKGPYLKGNVVWISNALNAAAHGMSINEKKIMMLAASKLLPSDKRENYSPKITLYVSDLVSAFGISREAATYMLKVATMNKPDANSISKQSRLSNRRSTWISLDAKDVKECITIDWVHATTYYRNEGRADIYICHKIVPFLTNLTKTTKGGFTRYLIEDASKAQTKHTFRLYEILQQHAWNPKKMVTIDVENLLFMLELGKSYKANFGLVTQDILKVAQHEFAEILKFTFETIVKGKKTISVKFTFPYKDKSKPLDSSIDNHQQ